MPKFSKFLDGLARGATGTHSVINKGFQKGIGSLIKETPANLSNGYLGLKPSALGTTAIVGAAVAYGGISSLTAVHQAARNNGDMSYQGAPPIFSGDGIQNTSSAPTLGANGSMVFGLHSMRRG